MKHYIRSFEKLMEAYHQDKPLHRFIQEFFRANPQMGSRDRKMISLMAYSYFRAGHIFPKISQNEKLAASVFLCNDFEHPLVQFLTGEFLNLSHDPLFGSLEEKQNLIAEIFPEVNFDSLFPFVSELSSEIDKRAFSESFLIQPELWIRVKQKCKEATLNELNKKAIVFKEYSEYPLTLSFKNGTKLDDLESFKKGYFEIQDLSSQLTSGMFKPHPKEFWWDACAASGGKSLMLLEQESSVNLVVSDIRASMTENLKERFKKNGIRNYQHFVADLTKKGHPFLTGKNFDGIIADLPCSGSGTWSRTPEMLSIFKESEISRYQQLQKTIASNIIEHLKPGKPLIYITCSVFKKENEDVVSFLTDSHKMKIEEMQYFKGYDRAADTLFAARLIKS